MDSSESPFEKILRLKRWSPQEIKQWQRHGDRDYEIDINDWTHRHMPFELPHDEEFLDSLPSDKLREYWNKSWAEVKRLDLRLTDIEDKQLTLNERRLNTLTMQKYAKAFVDLFMDKLLGAVLREHSQDRGAVDDMLSASRQKKQNEYMKTLQSKLEGLALDQSTTSPANDDPQSSEPVVHSIPSPGSDTPCYFDDWELGADGKPRKTVVRLSPFASKPGPRSEALRQRRLEKFDKPNSTLPPSSDTNPSISTSATLDRYVQPPISMPPTRGALVHYLKKFPIEMVVNGSVTQDNTTFPIHIAGYTENNWLGPDLASILDFGDSRQGKLNHTIRRLEDFVGGKTVVFRNISTYVETSFCFCDHERNRILQFDRIRFLVTTSNSNSFFPPMRMQLGANFIRRYAVAVNLPGTTKALKLEDSADKIDEVPWRWGENASTSSGYNQTKQPSRPRTFDAEPDPADFRPRGARY